MSNLRRGAYAVLALVLSVFAIVPHLHEGLVENVRGGEVLAQVGACDDVSARHFHAAKPIHAQPCVACTRQHATGTFRTVTASIVRPVVVDAIATGTIRHTAPSIVFTPLRGPPA